MSDRVAPLHLAIPLAVALGAGAALWGHIRANTILTEVLALRADAEAADAFLLDLARADATIRGYLVHRNFEQLEEAARKLHNLERPEALAMARKIDARLGLPVEAQAEPALVTLNAMRREALGMFVEGREAELLGTQRPRQAAALSQRVRAAAEDFKAELRPRLDKGKRALTAALDAVLWSVLASALLSLLALAATWRQHRGRTLAEAAARAALARSSTELGTLREVGELLQACETPEEVAMIARRAGERLLPGLALALFLEAESGGEALSPVAAWGFQAPERVPRAACWALKRGRPNDPASAVPCDACAPGGCCLCIPLLARGEAFGVLWAGGRPLSADETRLVTTLADQLAAALGDIRLREALRAQALRDPLTGLNNRRFLDEVGDKLCQQTMRRGGQLAVIMFDLDHFKALNDSLGHAAGDAALRRVGQIIAEGLRRSDICCRYGGEEFALILADCSLENAAIRAEQLRRRMEREPDARGVPAVTASFGVAALPACGTSMADLLRAADEALYRAKGAGRNRVETAAITPPPAPALRLAAGAD